MRGRLLHPLDGEAQLGSSRGLPKLENAAPQFVYLPLT